ncbi:MAG: L,D-transpeptidase [Labilithrix sp.]|nr:L,D-transpeptidase [Labilithrix sp.]
MSLFCVPAASCARAQPDPDVADAAVTTTSAASSESAAPTPAAKRGSVSFALPEAAEPDGPFVISFGPQAPIFSAPEWPARDASAADKADKAGVVRLGYLRRGGRAAIKGGVVTKASCAEGWYHLQGGGYVCGKYVTTDPRHKELRFAPHAPYMDRNLPYEYGLNITPGTPLYRRIPSKAERKENERSLALGKGAKSSDIAKRMKENGETLPAYLKDTSAKPKVAFDDLKGDSDLVAQRMLKGFYLSLDKKVNGRSGLLWHTTSGFLAPKDHLLLHEAKTEFEGVDLSNPDEKRKLPLAFVTSTKATQFAVGAEGDPTRGASIERFSILQLTGKREKRDKRTYHETDKGYWVRDLDVAVAALPNVPADLAPGEKWIDVDLRPYSQALVAFEGEKPVYATVVSTGRRDVDAEKDHRTVEGTFRIREKHVATTMDDDGASDGTYRIEDVPWVMYFEKSLALHGAFWHSSFGRERSHGCVNLTPHDARRIFQWAGPKLPPGWHGVRATKENPGTRIVTHR